MALMYDLDDYKLDTTFQPDCVLHTSYKADRVRGIRKIAVIERWIPQLPVLGSGAFGTVRLQRLQDSCENEQRRLRAVKELSKSRIEQAKIDYRKELIALTKFSRSKFIQAQVFVEFLGWFENDQSIYLAMEYFPLGTLDNFINETLKERDAQSITCQLLEGLHIMHEEGFTHRDLKPGNIFVVQKSYPDWWIKIGDFGITKRVSNDDTALQTIIGTPHYLAPEILHYVDIGENKSYTNAVDMWSFACIVYQLLALQTPFPVFPRNLVTFCQGGPFPDAPLFGKSQDSIDFVKSVLVPDPALRLIAKDALKSNWLQMDKKDTQNPEPQPEISQVASSSHEVIGSYLDTNLSTFQPYTWVSQSTSTPLSKRESIILSSSSPNSDLPSTRAPTVAKATEADARKYRIPPGYSLTHWNPSELPITLLGSVFDATSLGEWIHDWTIYHHGPLTPMADMASDLWELLTEFASNVKRAKECMPRIRTERNRAIINDFLIAGERLSNKLNELLKFCETAMIAASKETKGSGELGMNAGTEFVDTIFGRDRELHLTEKFMASIRLWNWRFQNNCEEIFSRPSQ